MSKEQVEIKLNEIMKDNYSVNISGFNYGEMYFSEAIGRFTFHPEEDERLSSAMLRALADKLDELNKVKV